MEQNGTTSPTQWEKYLFGNQSPLLPVFLLQHKPPRAFGDLQWLLCRWHHSQERRGRSWCDCGARGGDGAAAAAAELRSLALEGLPAALLPLTASPSQPQRLMSAHFNESFSILILFFFLVYLLICGQRSIPFSLYYSVKHLNLSILLGFIPLKFKVWGSGSWRCYSEGREVYLKEKGMLPHLFSRFNLPLL